MTHSFSARDLSRALRADVPRVDDDVFVASLAQVARTSAPAPASGRTVPRGVKVAAAVASVVVSTFGVAYAAGVLSSPEPAIPPPAGPGPQPPSDSDSGTRNPDRPAEKGSREDDPVSDPERKSSDSGRTDPGENEPAEAPAPDLDPGPEPTDDAEPDDQESHDDPESDHDPESDDGIEPEDKPEPEDGPEPDESEDGAEDSDIEGVDSESDSDRSEGED